MRRRVRLLTFPDPPACPTLVTAADTAAPYLERPEFAAYRDVMVALLRRYARLSVEIGRLPSLLGRECFRARLVSYHVRSFEDVAVFVIDVERCLERLDAFGRKVVAHVVLEEYTEEEAARVLGYCERQVRRKLAQCLDDLAAMFMASGMLKVPVPQPVPKLVKRGAAPVSGEVIGNTQNRVARKMSGLPPPI